MSAVSPLDGGGGQGTWWLLCGHSELNPGQRVYLSASHSSVGFIRNPCDQGLYQRSRCQDPGSSGIRLEWTNPLRAGSGSGVCVGCPHHDQRSAGLLTKGSIWLLGMKNGCPFHPSLETSVCAGHGSQLSGEPRVGREGALGG